MIQTSAEAIKPRISTSAGSYYSRLAVRSGQKSPNQETGLGNRERLKVLNDTKLILND